MAINEKKSLSNAEILDLAIKEKETKGEKKGTCYKMDDGRQYENYMDYDSFWDEFVKEMKETDAYKEAYTQYNKGSGHELEEWSNRKDGPLFPPKMASYGSSSRMIYLLSRGIEGFAFEKKLKTTIGRGKANLDGYLFRDGTHSYIEAKRREPYTAKSKNGISKKYNAVYAYLQNANIGFACKPAFHKDGKNMDVDFFIDGEKIHRFDLKQAICHLLAIANENLKDPDKAKEKTMFLYLLYDPSEVMEYIPPENREDICRIYREEKEECGRIPFEKLYRTILQYLGGGKVTEKEINRILENFTFRLCDQFEYGEIVAPSSAQKQ